ncbi:hypothetical protein D3C80_2093460 [compost metagenome]
MQRLPSKYLRGVDKGRLSKYMSGIFVKVFLYISASEIERMLLIFNIPFLPFLSWKSR